MTTIIGEAELLTLNFHEHFELGPLLLFFVVNGKWGIFVGTGVFIVATAVALPLYRVLEKRWPVMPLVGGFFVLVFGGLTLLVHDAIFIKWKPTVLYWLFGATLAGGQLLFGKNLIRSIMGKQVVLPEAAWRKLNWSWTGFFAFMGAANLYVAYNYSTDTWVNFKLFGFMGLMLAFVLLQGLMLSKYMEDKEDKGT